MPTLYPYNVFISHAWKYHDDYDRLVKLLDAAPNFTYKNYSVPRHDPCDAGNTKKLEQALKDQMRPSQVVLILAGMWVNHSGWIQYEIDYALQCGKPIVVIAPWGAQRTPTQLQRIADAVAVNWSTASIVEAIRKAVP